MTTFPSERARHSNAQRRVHDLTLVRRDSIGSAYHVLTFDSAEPLEAQPGQFAMVRGSTWGDAPLLPRPMSLLSGGNRPSILIKVVGEGTRRLAHASSGEMFSLLAPLGKPWSYPEHRKAIFVAGGVGIAPLLYFARVLREMKGPEVLALYGGRTRSDLPLSDDLGACTEMRIATEDGSRGVQGRITRLLEEALREHATSGHAIKVYTCGPDAMMARVAEMCAAAGVACEVSLETPMACGYGVCLGCPVPHATGGYLYACTEGPCVDAASIRWKTERPAT